MSERQHEFMPGQHFVFFNMCFSGIIHKDSHSDFVACKLLVTTDVVVL